jgi:hypothetical protein
MLRFILILLIIASLLKIAQENAYISFGIYLLIYVTFMIYTINSVDCEDIDYKNKKESDMLFDN